jgi:hemerythrin
MTWKDSMEIGISEIDGQHKELCGMADAFYNACVSGKGRTEVMRLLDFLEAYTVKHFAAEEQLQKTINYPLYKNHKAQHDDFRMKVSEIKKEISAWGVTTPVVKTVNEAVTSWLIKHIMGFDMDMKKYIPPTRPIEE